MRILFLIVIIIVAPTCMIIAQTNQEVTSPKAVDKQDEIFVSVQEMPEFPGGEDAIFKFIRGNISYPEEAKKKGIHGVVYVQFVVNKVGKLIDIEIARGVKDGELLDKEALRVIGIMPNWKPGYQNHEPAQVRLMLPIAFKLDELKDNKN